MASKWNELERWMEGQQLPKGFDILKEPDWVEQYVRRMMTKALPEAAGVIAGSGKADFSETKSYLYVTINLPEGCDPAAVRLWVGEDRLRVEGLSRGKIDIIRLPKLIKPRVYEALIKNQSLRVKLRKRPVMRKYYESAIRLK